MLNRICVVLLFILFVILEPAFGQKQGSIEVGGSLEFRGESNEQVEQNENFLSISPRLGFYLSRNLELEVESSVDFNFNLQQSLTNTESTLSILQHIATMEGGVSKLFISSGGGVWTGSDSEYGKRAKTVAGGIVNFGVGSKSIINRVAVIRAEVRMSYLFPSGEYYKRTRRIFQALIGIGLLL